MSCITHASDIVTYCNTSGRSDPGVIKGILLFTALDPPNWKRTLEAAQRAKSLGIRIAVLARGEDSVNAENFRKLSSGRMLVLGDEDRHLERIHELNNTGFLCRIMNTAEPVCMMSHASFAGMCDATNHWFITQHVEVTVPNVS